MGGDDARWKSLEGRGRSVCGRERGFGVTGVVKVSDRATRRRADNSAHSSFNSR